MCSIKELKGQAPDEFKAYYECLDYYRSASAPRISFLHLRKPPPKPDVLSTSAARSNNFEKCRKEQAAFEEKAPLPKQQ